MPEPTESAAVAPVEPKYKTISGVYCAKCQKRASSLIPQDDGSQICVPCDVERHSAR